MHNWKQLKHRSEYWVILTLINKAGAQVACIQVYLFSILRFCYSPNCQFSRIFRGGFSLAFHWLYMLNSRGSFHAILSLTLKIFNTMQQPFSPSNVVGLQRQSVRNNLSHCLGKGSGNRRDDTKMAFYRQKIRFKTTSMSLFPGSSVEFIASWWENRIQGSVCYIYYLLFIYLFIYFLLRVDPIPHSTSWSSLYTKDS